jgi:hypothetical protein
MTYRSFGFFVAAALALIANGAAAGTSSSPINNPWAHAARGVYALAQGGAAVVTPADTTEDTLATIAVPANAMGANGCLLIRAQWSYTNSSNAKTLRVRFESTSANVAFFSAGPTTFASTLAVLEICNRGATNSQVGQIVSATAPGNSTSSPTTGTVDTTDASLLGIYITGQKASSGETLTLESYSVRVAPSP